MPLQVLEPSKKSFALTTLEALLLLRLCQSIELDRFRVHDQLPDVEIRESGGDGGCGEECGGDAGGLATERPHQTAYAPYMFWCHFSSRNTVSRYNT
jgi:hypothetical protein